MHIKDELVRTPHDRQDLREFQCTQKQIKPECKLCDGTGTITLPKAGNNV